MRRHKTFPPGSGQRAMRSPLMAALASYGLAVALAMAPASAQESPAGEPLRQQVEARFEVLPLSDGLLLRPKTDLGGVRSIEVRDGDLAIDGDEAGTRELESRLGPEAAAPVRALLALDADELRELFGFDAPRGAASAVPMPPLPPPPPMPSLPASVPADVREEIEREVEEHQQRIEEQREELRRRIEEEMSRADEARERAHDQLERELERANNQWDRRDQDARVVVGSAVHVDAGETSGEVVSIGGGVTVDGEVQGDAVAVGGSARVRGTVHGTVVAVGGGVELGPDAHVHGDVVSVGGPLDRAPGAKVDGEIVEVSLWEGLAGGWASGWGGWTGRGRWGAPYGNYFEGSLGRLLRRSIFILVLLLMGALLATIARSPLESLASRIHGELWKAFVVGLLTIVMFVPVAGIVAVLLAVSVVGIPLLLLWPFAVLACCFAALFGYVAAALSLGRWGERRFGWRVQGTVTATVLGLFMVHSPILIATIIDVVDSSHDFAGFLVGMLWLFWAVLQFGVWSAGVGSLLLRGTPAVPPAPPLPGSHPYPGGPGPAVFPASSAAVTATAAGAAATMATSAPAAVDTAPPAAGAADWEEDRWDEPFAGFGAGAAATEAGEPATVEPATVEPAEEGDEDA